VEREAEERKRSSKMSILPMAQWLSLVCMYMERWGRLFWTKRHS